MLMKRKILPIMMVVITLNDLKVKYVIIDDLTGISEPGLYDAEISAIMQIGNDTVVEIHHCYDLPCAQARKPWRLEQESKSKTKPPKKGRRK